jgi:glycosyltransferase involved in cell wall biosynthesis
VVLEAMSMQLPVVSTRHSAIPEAIIDGVNGLLVPPEDAQALAVAFENLLLHSDLRRCLGTWRVRRSCSGSTRRKMPGC